MAFVAAGSPVSRVHSTVWKAHFRLPADKSRAVDRACQLFPDDAHQWRYKARNGRMAELDGHAEAALIARYARDKLATRKAG
jgi:hypothetical protein